MKPNFLKKSLLILVTLLLAVGCDSTGSSDDKKTNRQLLALANIATNDSDAQADATANQLARNFLDIDENFNENSEMKTRNLEMANKVLKTDESGRITFEEQIKNCPNGGTVTVSGGLDLTLISLTDTFNKDIEISNSTRTSTFQNCSMRDGMKIVSGTMTMTQIGTSKINISKSGSIVSEKADSHSMNRVGSLNIQRAMNVRTIDVGVNTTVKATKDILRLTYTLDENNNLTEPRLLEIKGSVSGSATISTPRGLRTRNIERTIDKKFD
ncbi:MAG: hypothetical protein IPL26_29590 [Leptospiraceae bacterium]|nr:hypothetical protein [Leptospiraceae bacterium]